MATPVAVADHYLQVGFTAGAGTLAVGASTGQIQNAVNKTDWSNFTQTGDYSFNAADTAFTANPAIAANGGSVGVGFNGTDTGQAPAPTVFSLNETVRANIWELIRSGSRRHAMATIHGMSALGPN